MISCGFGKAKEDPRMDAHFGEYLAAL
jgi:hypothetical protein